jgi:hypothetical protein
MAINVAYCFHQNNDVAHQSVFANMPRAQAAVMRPLLKILHSKNLSSGVHPGRIFTGMSTSVPSRKTAEAAGAACAIELRELSALQ